ITAASFAGGTPITSGGHAVTYSFDASTGTLTATANGQTVFTVAFDAAGDSYTFTLKQPLDHPVASGDDNEQIDLKFNFTATDSDGSPVSGSVTVHEFDDVPQASGQTVSGIVEEEALPGGNQELGDPTPDTAVSAGSLTTLVTFGADQPGTFS